MSTLRSAVIRLASTLPVGSPSRKALLAAVQFHDKDIDANVTYLGNDRYTITLPKQDADGLMRSPLRKRLGEPVAEGSSVVFTLPKRVLEDATSWLYENGTVLKQAGNKEARREWEPVVSGDKVRIQMQDHPDNRLQIQEVPGKPFKQKLRRREYNTYYFVQNLHPGGPFLMSNIVMDAKLSAGMSFEQAVGAMDAALEAAKDEVLKNEAHQKYNGSHPGIYPAYTLKDLQQLGYPRSIVSDDLISFLEVEPADYKPVQFEGKDFSGTAQWTSFRYYAASDEDEWMAQNEGMNAFHQSTSPGGARKLFKLLKADPSMVKNMTSTQFGSFLVQNKIGVDYVPTVWR